ncbi:hypothetical protein [Pelagicoccus albus]|uniref:Uncharacterized protein n=1 Tax=Pelagicoccus albus TaxID=415222 RepID=A0A7X1B3K4_9BACT|nr:hypothetical protein [Pelagicoccus albus]MBC2604779.1 hypothetical protein [Pelagicoccus albus]
MKINWINSIIAGILGTILFDLSGFFMTGTWWDIPGLIGQKLGFGLLGGLPVHYGNGIALAVIYAALRPSLFGPEWFRAFAYTTAQTVLIVWFFMLPLLGAGIAGWDLNKALPIITLVRHYAYMVPLAFMLNPESRFTSLFGKAPESQPC